MSFSWSALANAECVVTYFDTTAFVLVTPELASVDTLQIIHDKAIALKLTVNRTISSLASVGLFIIPVAMIVSAYQLSIGDMTPYWVVPPIVGFIAAVMLLFVGLIKLLSAVEHAADRRHAALIGAVLFALGRGLSIWNAASHEVTESVPAQVEHRLGSVEHGPLHR